MDTENVVKKIRDFERAFQIEGIGIRFMKANKDGYVILRNVDENGHPVEREIKEVSKQNSMHNAVPWFLWVIGIAAFGACFIP